MLLVVISAPLQDCIAEEAKKGDVCCGSRFDTRSFPHCNSNAAKLYYLLIVDLSGLHSRLWLVVLRLRDSVRTAVL
jgi:hypothetical protein